MHIVLLTLHSLNSPSPSLVAPAQDWKEKAQEWKDKFQNLNSKNTMGFTCALPVTYNTLVCLHPPPPPPSSPRARGISATKHGQQLHISSTSLAPISLTLGWFFTADKVIKASAEAQDAKDQLKRVNSPSAQYLESFARFPAPPPPISVTAPAHPT